MKEEKIGEFSLFFVNLPAGANKRKNGFGYAAGQAAARKYGRIDHVPSKTRTWGAIGIRACGGRSMRS